MPSTSTSGLLLFLVHTVVEIGLGLVKLRGRYAGFEMPPGAEKFARHHGVSLLSLALLGGLVLFRRSWAGPEGLLASTVLAFFHLGCVCVRPAMAVLMLHGFLFFGFSWYSYLLSKPKTK